MLKRAIDLIGSILLIFFLSPLLLSISIAIKLYDGGTVFFRRRVVGVNGIHFDAFKFRTMVQNADNILANNPDLMAEFKENYKIKNDPRITRMGNFLRKTSFDELPQLFNVIKGQMSLVGPRMVTPEELEQYGALKEERICFKPGITGYWQVNGRQEVDYNERIQMDMFYLRHWNIWLDIQILFKTVLKVIRMEGAY
jgi:lipopolysaccharide/colanic/teichoic acid biosynthesis glycosyltransferase